MWVRSIYIFWWYKTLHMNCIWTKSMCKHPMLFLIYSFSRKLMVVLWYMECSFCWSGPSTGGTAQLLTDIRDNTVGRRRTWVWVDSHYNHLNLSFCRLTCVSHFPLTQSVANFLIRRVGIIMTQMNMVCASLPDGKQVLSVFFKTHSAVLHGENNPAHAELLQTTSWMPCMQRKDWNNKMQAKWRTPANKWAASEKSDSVLPDAAAASEMTEAYSSKCQDYCKCSFTRLYINGLTFWVLNKNHHAVSWLGIYVTVLQLKVAFFA